MCAGALDDADQLIETLLRTPEDERPAALGTHMQEVLTLGFLNALQSRISTSEVYARDGQQLSGGLTAQERSELQALFETVLDFSEGVASGIRVLEPIAAKAQHVDEAAAEVERARAAAIATATAADTTASCQCCAADTIPTATPPPSQAGGGAGGGGGGGRPNLDPISGETEAVARRAQARNRFKLEQLLDAAAKSGALLDQVLQDMSADLDAAFFAHMQWELEEQVKRKNSKLLQVLEIVIQRACVQVEAGEPSVQLLSSLLQARDRQVRQELFELSLAPASPVLKQRFGASVEDTRVHLEKALMRGESIDMSLLRQLRLITIEMAPYMLPRPDDWDMPEMEGMGI